MSVASAPNSMAPLVSSVPAGFFTLKEAIRLTVRRLPAAFSRATNEGRFRFSAVLLGTALAENRVSAWTRAGLQADIERVPFTCWESAFDEALQSTNDLGDLEASIISNALCGPHFGAMQGLMPLVREEALGHFLDAVSGIAEGPIHTPLSDLVEASVAGALAELAKTDITGWMRIKQVKLEVRQRITLKGLDVSRESLREEFALMLDELGIAYVKGSLNKAIERSQKLLNGTFD